VTATFATRYATRTWSFDRDDFSISVEFLHGHRPTEAWLAPTTSTKVRILEGMKDLVATDKVLKFRLGLTATDFLKPAATGLTHSC
jgi:hypothetical protein